MQAQAHVAVQQQQRQLEKLSGALQQFLDARDDDETSSSLKSTLRDRFQTYLHLQSLQNFDQNFKEWFFDRVLVTDRDRLNFAKTFCALVEEFRVQKNIRLDRIRRSPTQQRNMKLVLRFIRDVIPQSPRGQRNTEKQRQLLVRLSNFLKGICALQSPPPRLQSSSPKSGGGGGRGQGRLKQG